MPPRVIFPAISAAIASLLTLIAWAVLAIVLIHNQPTVADPFSIAASTTPFSQTYVEIVVLTSLGMAIPVITSASTGSAPGRFGLAALMTAFAVGFAWLAAGHYSEANGLIWLAAGLAAMAGVMAAFPGAVPNGIAGSNGVAGSSASPDVPSWAEPLPVEPASDQLPPDRPVSDQPVSDQLPSDQPASDPGADR